MRPRTLCARLTLSLLLILLPVLGGGGLFWFRGEARLLQSEFDTVLRALADQARGLITKPRQSESPGAPCAQLSPLFGRLSAHKGIAVFSPGGELLCSVGELAPQADLLDRVRIETVLAGQRHFLTHKDSEKLSRSLALPIFRQGRASEILLVSDSYLGQQRQARQQAFVLSGLLIASGLLAVILGWFLVRRQLRPLGLLTKRILALRDSDAESGISEIDGAPQETIALQGAVEELVAGLRTDLGRARQFTADASHELRTPLTILREETEVALRWAQDPEEIRKALVSNLEEIDRMSRIIEDLLLLSKSEEGEMPLRFETLDLLELLGELCQQAQMLGEQKGVAVGFGAPDQEIRIQGDPLRLRQLFLNLLSNAIKYTPAAGNVQLMVRMLGALVEIKVVDSGIGIEPHHQARIFDRFYRVDKTRNRSDGGSGLGLSIAQLIAESHGGAIRVCSVPGQGSEFVVVLPSEQSVCDDRSVPVRN